MDDEFRELFQRIKLLARSLPRSSDCRHHVAMWIKKLLSERNHDKATCNHYTRLLLNALQQSQLQAPFTASPPLGPLPLVKDELDKLLSTSPEHCANTDQLKETLSVAPTLPHRMWKPSDRNASFTSPDDRKYKPSLRSLSVSPKWKQTITTSKLLKLSSSDSSDDEQEEIKTKSSTPKKTSANVKKLSNEDSDDLFAEISISPSPANKHSPIVLGQSPHKVTFEAPKLSHQCSSETSQTVIKNFLDQKNSEIEALRVEYSQKTCQMELKCHNLENKVTQLEKQLSIKRDEQSKELQRIKEASNQQLQQSKSKLKNKFQSIINEMEREKIDMEHEKYHDLQSVIDDANKKLSSLEAEKVSLRETIQNLESKSRQLAQQLDITQQMKDAYLKEKSQLQGENSALEIDIKQANERIRILEESCSQIKAEKDDTIRKIQEEAEKALSELKIQMARDQSCAAKKINCLQEEVKALQKCLEDVSATHRHKMAEMESSTLKQLQNKETEIKELQVTLQQKQSELLEALSSLKAALKEKESKLNDLQSKLDLQTKKMEKSTKEQHSSMQKLKDQHLKALQQKQKVIENLEKNLCDIARKLEEQPAKLEAKHKERHANEVSVLSEKVQHLQHDYEIKISLAEESIASLSMQVKDLQEEKERMKAEHDEEIKELKKGNELELNQLRIHYASEETAHSKALADARAKIEALETEIIRQKKLHDSQLSQIKASTDQQHILSEKEHENIVEGLKLEIYLLTERAELLQKQLAQLRTCSNLRKHMKSCHKKH